MWHLRRNVHRAWHGGQCVQVLRETLPVVLEPFRQRAAGDVFNPFHQADQVIVLIRLGGCKSNPTIAHHDRSDAMPCGWRHISVPRSLSVVMGVAIHPSRHDQAVCSVNFALALAGDTANGTDAPIVDGNVS